MAQRDRAQGFGFVYVDVEKLLKETKEKQSSPEVTPAGAPVVNFNKDISTSVPNTGEKNTAIQQIRENLDRLQTLHHKLHAILEDLNKLADPKKKST